MRLSGLAVATCIGASSLGAQAGSTPRVELSAGVSHFAQYVSEDARTNQTGGTIELRLTRADGAAVELAYTLVPQKATTASAAPRLDLARVAFGWTLPLDSRGRAALLPTLGAAWLQVDAQTIDCGDFPICSEWAPADASLMAAVGGVGLRGRLGRHWALRAAGLAYLPLGRWQADRWQSLLELRLLLSAGF